MEGEFTSSEWQTTENRNATINHPIRCFQKRLGGSLSGNHHRENLVILGKDKTYQCARAHCSETCNINLYQGKIGNNTPLTNRQYGSSALLGKNGGNSQSRIAKSNQGNIWLSVSQSNSSYCRVLRTKQSEYSGRLAIQKLQRLKRLEIEPQNIFSDCKNQKNTSNRSICFPTESSATKIHVLASGPRQLCSRFPSTLLEKPLRVCILFILFNREGTCQESEGVSKLAATLTSNSRRSGSISNYPSAWRKWASYCYEREVNPFTSDIIEILNFLAFIYEKG